MQRIERIQNGLTTNSGSNERDAKSDLTRAGWPFPPFSRSWRDATLSVTEQSDPSASSARSAYPRLLLGRIGILFSGLRAVPAIADQSANADSRAQPHTLYQTASETDQPDDPRRHSPRIPRHRLAWGVCAWPADSHRRRCCCHYAAGRA